MGDPKTLLPQVDRVRRDFGITNFVLVGDRGMITQEQIDVLRQDDGIDWIAALRPEGIRKLVACGAIQMGLFDERNLFELIHPDFPGERLAACRNPELARRRAQKRQSLLAATIKELETIQRMVGRGRLRDTDEIGVRIGKVVNEFKVGKHILLGIDNDRFDFAIDSAEVAAEAALDGIYVVRSSFSEQRLSAADTVRSYKLLGQVERRFRSLKTMDLHLRPIRDRLEVRRHDDAQRETTTSPRPTRDYQRAGRAVHLIPDLTPRDGAGYGYHRRGTSD